MARMLFSCVFGVFFALCSSLGAALTPEQLAQLPPPANHPIDFGKEIKPIFEASCVNCHGHGREKGGFKLDTRETFLKGSDSGPVVVPGKSADSLLIGLVQGFDPDSVMPKKGTRLTPEQIGLLRAWIDQGVAWDQRVTFARAEPLNLKRREPQLPPGSAAANPIDRLLQPYYAAHKFTPANPVTDRVFARRVYLDVIGLLPPPEKLDAFAKDLRPDKRKRLVELLLSDNANYAEHWLSFWNDMLRNDYKGTGYIDGGRKQITGWLYSALLTNMPYNEFVAELINPSPASEGFTKGIVWRGVVNASQTPQMQAAQSICQVFMGVNLKCASCHDSFVNDLTLSDSYGLAGIYADGPLEMVRCDKPTGKKADLHFIYPELGKIEQNADKPARLKRLAEIIAGPQDGRLTRTLVNRFWQRLFGRGLVEPVDEMEKAAWSPDLLDWLAEDFANHDYDVKFLLERILTSKAYQLPSSDSLNSQQKDYVFTGPCVRRMDAEEFRDAVFSLTGRGGRLPDGKYELMSCYVSARPYLKAQAHIPPAAKWIWNNAAAAQGVKHTTLYFRKEIFLTNKPAEATVIVTADENFTLYTNGEKVGSGQSVNKPSLFDLTSRLKKGRNVIAISAANKEPKKDDKTNAPPVRPETPAGLLVIGRAEVKDNARKHFGTKVVEFWSDPSWNVTDKHRENWEKTNFKATNWVAATALGPVDMSPWKVKQAVIVCSGVASEYGHFRASLVDASPLVTALGRPNREQVVTTRTPEATTLQALELTNGSELDRLLDQGADALINDETFAPKGFLITRIYRRALGRRPTPVELASTSAFIGKPLQPEAVKDLLWSLAMLPEFQLIY